MPTWSQATWACALAATNAPTAAWATCAASLPLGSASDRLTTMTCFIRFHVQTTAGSDVSLEQTSSIGMWYIACCLCVAVPLVDADRAVFAKAEPLVDRVAHGRRPKNA